MHMVLSAGGVAYFKVWAGSWPERGTGVSHLDEGRGVFQANRWASGFQCEVESIFGAGNVFVDNNINLLVAVKRKLAIPEEGKSGVGEE